MRTDWFKIMFLYNSTETELARTVDIMMVRAKRTYILMIRVNKLFSFLSHNFLKQIGNMFSMFPSSYKNTLESLGEQGL